MNNALADRFWANVRIAGPDECWEWGRGRIPKGYGMFYIGGKPYARRSSHRMAWELTHGEIPEGMFVCHRCDNPPCCNPAHLFLGTPQENVLDRLSKGRCNYATGARHGTATRPERVARGERSGGAKLKDWQIPYIRTLLAAGVFQIHVALAYGVTDPTISNIATGTTWRDENG